MDIRKNGKSGMTLIEILVVIALLGVLAAVLVRSVGGSMDAGKKATANLFCDTTFKSAVEAYKVSHGNRLPPTMAALSGFLGANPTDPWGKAYGFEATGDGVYCYCVYGEDAPGNSPAAYAPPPAPVPPNYNPLHDIEDYNNGVATQNDPVGHVGFVQG